MLYTRERREIRNVERAREYAKSGDEEKVRVKVVENVFAVGNAQRLCGDALNIGRLPEIYK